jgi:hypothetical protein
MFLLRILGMFFHNWIYQLAEPNQYYLQDHTMDSHAACIFVSIPATASRTHHSIFGILAIFGLSL